MSFAVEQRLILSSVVQRDGIDHRPKTETLRKHLLKLHNNMVPPYEYQRGPRKGQVAKITAIGEFPSDANGKQN